MSEEAAAALVVCACILSAVAALLSLAWFSYQAWLRSRVDEWKMRCAEPLVPLAECPTGLFITCYGELGIKTEYGSTEGRVDAYIVATGAFFWGEGPQTIESQNSQLVYPVEIEGEPA